MCLGTSQGENDAEPYFNKIVCGDEDGRSSAILKDIWGRHVGRDRSTTGWRHQWQPYQEDARYFVHSLNPNDGNSPIRDRELPIFRKAIQLDTAMTNKPPMLTSSKTTKTVSTTRLMTWTSVAREQMLDLCSSIEHTCNATTTIENLRLYATNTRRS